MYKYYNYHNKKQYIVNCTGKIHLIVIIVNDGYNIDIKGGLCLYGGGHPLFFDLTISKSNHQDAQKQK